MLKNDKNPLTFQYSVTLCKRTRFFILGFCNKMYQKTALSEGHTALLAVCMCIIGITAMALDDWHFYGKNIALHNNALQQPATYCDRDIYHKCYPASLAVDGNTDGYFKHGSCSHTIGKASVDASWTVYLGKPFNVTGIVVYNRDDVKIRLKDFMIYGDGHTLIHNSAGTDEYNKNILSFTLDGLRSFSTITVLLPKQHGYSGGGNYYLTLCEVKIYAAPRPACDAKKTNVNNGQTKVYNSTGRLINHQYTFGTIIDVVCNNNFHVNGSSRFQCLATGKYNVPIPECIEACLPILKPNNGHVIPDLLLYRVNTSLKIICDVGYETQEADLIHCQTGGKWENPIPTCQLVHCSLPKKHDHGYYSLNGHTEIDNFFYSNLPYMSEIIGLCNTGYKSNNVQRRICKSDKTWSDTETMCTPIQCSKPRNATNTVYSFKNGSKICSGNTFDYNTVLQVSCQVGYIVLGQTERTCQSNKTWSGKEPHCSVVTCDFPGHFDNGQYVIKDRNITNNNSLTSYLTGNLDFSTEIEAVCKVTYMFNSTSNIRKCTATGLWDGQTPTCVPVICTWPLPLDNGYYIASENVKQFGMPYNTTLKAACNEMYKLSHSYSSRRCNEDAVWDKAPAVCEPICKLPSVDNGRFLNVMSSQFEIGKTLTFTCDPGFTAAGSTDTIVCQDNHQWSAKPMCQIRHSPSQPTETEITKSFCKLPKITNGKFINVVSTQFELGRTLRFACDSGFTASAPDDTITCQKNHQWSAEPVCQVDRTIPQPIDTTITEPFCHLPYITNGKIVNVMSTQLEFGTTLRFTCDPGFTATESTDTVTCQENHQWSTTPICQAERDTTHNAVIYGVIITAAVVITVALVVFIIRRRLKHAQMLRDGQEEYILNENETDGSNFCSTVIQICFSGSVLCLQRVSRCFRKPRC